MNKIDYFGSGLILGMLIIVIVSTIIVKSNTTAIDVYKNKTTLEITYRDSIPIDSVVVYK